MPLLPPLPPSPQRRPSLRLRRQTEAAQAQVYASEQGQRGVVLTLVAGVATSYIVLRSLDRQLEIAQATARNFEGTLRIFELRYKAGMISMTELSQIRSQTQQARAAIAAVRRDGRIEDRAGLDAFREDGALQVAIHPHLDVARAEIELELDDVARVNFARRCGAAAAVVHCAIVAAHHPQVAAPAMRA